VNRMSLIESFRSLLAWLRRIAMQTHARFTRAIVELGEREQRGCQRTGSCLFPRAEPLPAYWASWRSIKN
jgi:hypothetical protein